MDYYIAPVDEETDFLPITKPEQLTVIDPACGSGHMLTYAFDLLYAIYEEEGYTPSQIPGLILANNLYGTEIDPRAGALAAFALTMKAAAKRKLFLKNPVEPNVCVLEPISFRADELDYLVTADGDRDAEEAFWNQFADADTFGALIQPDPELTVWLADHLGSLNDEGDLFRADALRWAQRVIDQAGYLTSGYAVVVANPPYMGSKQMNAKLAQFMKSEYRGAKSDLFAAFIERCASLAGPRGTTAMVTMQSWMFLSSYEKLRASLLTRQWIASMLHLGTRAFDSIGGEVVSSTAFVLTNVPPENRGTARERRGVFIRLVDRTSEAAKIAALHTALDERTKEAGFNPTASSDFAAIPGSPIVYWLSEKMRAAFRLGKQLREVAEPRQGLATADNNRFLRQWWEVAANRTAFACESLQAAGATGAKWFPYNKGGDFRRWYGNQEFVVNWEGDGVEIRKFGTEGGSRPRSRAQNTGTYFSPSVSWSKISSGAPAFRAYPPGFIFDVAGTSMFADTQRDRDALIAFTNSQVAYEQLSAVAPTMNFEVGQVAGLPFVDDVQNETVDRVAVLAEQSAADWDTFEVSWNFAENPLIRKFQDATPVPPPRADSN
ncbi:BREX-1 system adenine-specific DNA-methyltransferase PglX [Gordonia iterans]